MDTALIVAGMMVVTFGPRLAPFYLVAGATMPRYLTRFFHFLPVTALGALIFPGVLDAVPENPVAAAVSMAAAAIVALFIRGLIAPVAVAVTAAFLWLAWMA